MRWFTLRQLKALRRFPVPPEVLEAGRRNLLIVMAESPMSAGRSMFRAFIWKPAMAAFVVVVFVAVSSGGVVYAAQGTVPGDRLYPVKLVSEGVQERLTITPERKFAVQAAHAAKRLEETQVLMDRGGLDPQERQVRVLKAMSGYEKRLDSMKLLEVKLSVDPPKPVKEKGRIKMRAAAERVLDRHADLVASATASDPDVAEAVLEPIDASVKLEDDIFNFTHLDQRDDGAERQGDDEEKRQWEMHRKERGDRLTEHLKRLRAGLLVKPLEIKAGM